LKEGYNVSLIFSEFIVGRIDEIASDLRKTNAEYALAIDKSSRYYESLEPIIMSTTEEYTISHGDCLNFKEFLDEELASAAIMQQELYRRGYLDCVKLLRMLGVLA